MLSEALEHLESTGTLITANQRQARVLIAAYAERQTQRGLTVWEAADVLPWGIWLQRCWQQLATQDQRLLLNPAQERLLWESVLRQQLSDSYHLINPQTLARTAQQAWSLVQDWHLPFPFDKNLSKTEISAESMAFQRWALAMQRRCREQGWIENAGLPAALRDVVQQGLEPHSPLENLNLALYGFEEVTPAQAALLEAFRQQGSDYRVLELARVDQLSGDCLAAQDSSDEINRAAVWARNQLLDQPNKRIAWVVPDLQLLSNEIQSVLTEVLTPSRLLPSSGQDGANNMGTEVFNISLGQPLNEYSVVRTALLLLQLAARRSLPLAEAGQLLRSPWCVGFDKEASARAEIDRRLRMRGELNISLDTLLFVATPTPRSDRKSADGPNLHPSPLWVKSLKALQHQGWADQRQSLMDWVDWARSSLDVFGWPGLSPALSSEQNPAINPKINPAINHSDSLVWQCVKEWQEQLSGLIDAGVIVGEVTAWRFLSLLENRISETQFQPGSGHSEQAPLQVLGILEAAGLPFDSLRFIGMHNDAWPVAARPNALLPLSLQMGLQDQDQQSLPHSSAQRELEYAKRLLLHLCHMPEEVCFSYPLQRDDAELQISGLLTHLPLSEPDLPLNQPSASHPYWQQQQASSEQQTFTDEQASASAGCSGGSYLIKLQAACPFRAYATLRLAAKPLETVEPGLDARTRGNLVHDALQRLWTELGDHQTLVTSDADTRQTLCHSAVEATLTEHAKRYPHQLPKQYRHIEQQRLTSLLIEWLNIEEAREPFHVLGCETSQQVEISGCTLQVRLDRLDQLNDGGLVIMDYKTGKTSVASLAGERPDEPQLPLYALAVEAGREDPLIGLSFGQLRAGECATVGLSQRNGVLPKVGLVEKNRSDTVKPLADWQALQQQWHEVLPRLVNNFKAGIASVDPKDSKKTCQYCDLGGLCRIKEYEQDLGTDTLGTGAE